MTFFKFKPCRHITAISALTLLTACAQAADINIFNGDSFESAAEALQPGDTLIVHEGTYIDSGRISVSVRGTAANPVLIKGADGENRPLITRSTGDTAQNTINIEGASYLTIEGLEISSNGGDGINLSASPSYITLRDLEIHDISVGLNFRSSMHHMTVQRNHIYNTNDTGEGMYVGCHAGDCAVSDSVFEQNWIHDTNNAEQGDGIEIKRGSHSNIIRDNVIHDTHYPCLLLYGTDGNPRNIVERNVVWNCGDAAIQAAADTIIRNNILFASVNRGLASQSHAGVNPDNLEFVHNTIVGGSPCVYTSGWSDKSGMIFANNAVYCAAGNVSFNGGLNGVTIAGNVFEPMPSGISTTENTAGRSAVEDFVDDAGKDVYPTQDSALLSAGNALYLTQDDFNGTARSSGLVAGAYTWTSTSNPGWAVVAGFKNGVTPGPTLTFNANPQVVPHQGQSTLSWSTQNATSCQASGDWTGSKPLSGQEDSGVLTSDSSYTLTCTNDEAVSVSATVTIDVDDPTAQPALSLTSDASSVPLNGSTIIRWSSTNVDACEASGAWSGAKPASGSEGTGSLTSSAIYHLVCSGPGGSTDSSVSVQVQATGDGGTKQDAGGGSVFWLLIVLLGLNCRRIASSR